MISFLSVFPPYRGGIANFSDYLYKNLSDKTDVRCFGFQKLYPSVLFPGKTQFDLDSAENYALPLHHGYNPLKWANTGRIIGRDEPSVLLLSLWHPFFIPSFNRVIEFVKRTSPSTKIVTIAHNVKPHDAFPMADKLSTDFIQNNDLIITLSEQTTRELQLIDPEKEHIQLFHPIYEADFPDESASELKQRYGYKTKEKVILFFGLIRPYKGLDVMINALNSIDLHSLNARVLIAGEFYEPMDTYEDMIHEDHRELYTFDNRFLSNEEMAEVMTLSEVMILPYKSASQSGILANAINFELPCIVADHAGLIEHIEHEKNALIFKSEDVDHLAEVTESYLRNDSIQKKIRKKLKKLKDKLSWDKFGEDLFKILE